MRKHKNARRGVSFGTIWMLTLTALTLVGFCMLVQTFTGGTDIRINAAELAVAVDQSLSQIASSASQIISSQPTNEPLSAEELAIWSGSDAPATQTPQPVATTPPTYRFSLCAAGSMVFNTAMFDALTYDGVYRFETLFDDALVSAMQSDMTLVTLESTVMDSQKVSNNNAPLQLLPAMRDAGIQLVCLGYPGILAGGIEGLKETQNVIRAAGMTPYGVYESQAARQALNSTMAGEVKVALLSYQDRTTSASRNATTEDERAFALAPLDADVIAADIAAARQAGAQVVLVSLCWGDQGDTTVNDDQVAFAQTIADAGADIILGTYPGALQTVQILTAERGDGKYHPVLCAYSLGNLVTHDREKRISISSILLNAQVVYDSATGLVAFDELSYTPTYAWRGREDGVQRYRILVNDGVNYPDYVGDDQKAVMERCLKVVTDAMENSPIPSAV